MTDSADYEGLQLNIVRLERLKELQILLKANGSEKSGNRSQSSNQRKIKEEVKDEQQPEQQGIFGMVTGFFSNIFGLGGQPKVIKIESEADEEMEEPDKSLRLDLEQLNELRGQLIKGLQKFKIPREEDLVVRAHDAYNSGEHKLREKYLELVRIRIKIKTEELKQLKEVLADHYTPDQINNMRGTVRLLEKESIKLKIGGNDKAVRQIQTKIDQLNRGIKLEQDLATMVECTNEHVKLERPGTKRPIKEEDVQNPTNNFESGQKRIKLENQLDMTFGPSSQIQYQASNPFQRISTFHQEKTKDQKAVDLFKETQLLMNFNQFVEEHKMKALQTYLIKGDLQIYKTLSDKSEFLTKSASFTEFLTQQQQLVQVSDWSLISNNLYQKFEKYPHLSMKLYYLLDSHHPLKLENPYHLDQASFEISNLYSEAPPEFKEIHKNLQKLLNQGQYERLLQVYSQHIENQRTPYQNQMCEIVSRLVVYQNKEREKREKERVMGMFHKLAVEVRDHQEFIGFKEAIVQKSNKYDSQYRFQIMMSQINEEAMTQLYDIAIKIDPDFSTIVTHDHIILNYAPAKIKQYVSDILKIARSNNYNEDNQQALSDLFQRIFFENEEYSQKLAQKIDQIIHSEELNQILRSVKSLKDLRNDDVTLIDTMLRSPFDGMTNIQEFTAVHIDFKLDKAIEEVVEELNSKKQFNHYKLQLILFDLIKKRCNFERVVAAVQGSNFGYDIPITQQALVRFLMRKANSQLKGLLLMACSTFMPLPLLSYELPKKSQDGTQPPPQLLLLDELFYPFEKFLAVLNFKVSDTRNTSPRGCTTLANDIFQRTFERHAASHTNYGSIELQFDYNFTNPLLIPVADAHGALDIEGVLPRIVNLFDFYIVHAFKGHLQAVNRAIAVIKKEKPKSMIVVIEQQENKMKKNFEITNLKDLKQLRIQSCLYDELLPSDKNKLKEVITKAFLEEIKGFEEYQDRPEVRLQSMHQFTNFLSGFGKSPQIYLDTLQGVSILMSLIHKNKDDLHSEAFMPLNSLHTIKCMLEIKLACDSNLTDEEKDMLSFEITTVSTRLKKNETGEIAKVLQDTVFKHSNYAGFMTIFSRLLKSYLGSIMKPLIAKRIDLQNQIEARNTSAKTKEELMKQICQTTVEIEKRWFSSEFIIREEYLYAREQERYNQYLNYVDTQIKQGQPFEIIDGNNLQFTRGVFDKLFNPDGEGNENILVVSVIGPQSSGKSLLLNTLFGAQFLSSAGRCTRGIYGCLLNIKDSSSGSKYKKILLLDSEGIQSTEKRDPQFDKRIVFYILCVSHVVLICNKGEMNSQMQEMIKLATDSISQLKYRIIQQPQVNIIMNMVPVIDEMALSKTIQELTNYIYQVNQQQTVQQIFTITNQNVFMLPSAFSSSSMSDKFIVNYPSAQFAQLVDPIRQKIIDFARKNILSPTEEYTLRSWFDFASNFWSFSENFNDMQDYNNMEERKLDQILHEKINKIMDEQFLKKDKQEENHQKVTKIVQSVLERRQGYEQIKVDIIYEEVKQQIIPFQKEIEYKIIREFQEFCRPHKNNLQIIQKREYQLSRQLVQHFYGWDQIAHKLISQYNDKKSQFVGDQQLQEEINLLLKEKDTYSSEEATEQFNTKWDQIAHSMASMLDSRQKIEDRSFQDISELYKANIKGYQEKINVEKEYQKKLMDSRDTKIFMEQIERQKNFFYIQSNFMSLTVEEYNNSLKSNPMYNDHLSFYEVIQIQEEYKWKQLVEERFQFQVLHDQILLSFLDEGERLWDYQNRIRYLNEIADLIVGEGQQFEIGCSDLAYILRNFEREVFVFGEIQNFKNSSLDLEDRKKPLLLAVKNFVIKVRQQITKYFNFEKVPNYQNSVSCLDFKFYNTYQRYDTLRNGWVQDRYYSHNYNNQKQIVRMETRQVTNISQYQSFPGIERRQNCKHVLQVREEMVPEMMDYLNHIINPERYSIHKSHTKIQNAMKIFKDKVKWGKVLKKIEKIVLTNIRRPGCNNGKDSVTQACLSLCQSNSVNEADNYLTLDYKIIQTIVSEISQIISKIDESVKPYRVKISEEGIFTLHRIAQNMIVWLQTEINWLREQGPVFAFNQTRDIQQKLFVAKLTSNDLSMDTSLGERTAEQLVLELTKLVSQTEIKNFQDMIAAESDQFNMQQIVVKIENFLLSKAKQEGIKIDDPNIDPDEEVKDSFMNLRQDQSLTMEDCVQFYVQPKKFLETRFQKMWQKISQSDLSVSQRLFKQKMHSHYKSLQNYFQKLLQKILEKDLKLAMNVFIPDEHAKIQDNKVRAQLAFTQYLVLLMKSDWTRKSKSLVVNQDTPDEATMHVSPTQAMLYPADLGLTLDTQLIDILSKQLNKETISNFETFITSFLNRLASIFKKPPELSQAALIGNAEKDLRAKTVGCEQHCPLCRKQCDQQHDEGIQDRQHRCEQGHQIQGFGGNRQVGKSVQHKNKAIVVGCHELKEDDMVVYEDKKIEWGTFKGKFFRDKNWFLDVDEDQQSLMQKRKNAQIWNLIGPKICEYYTTQENIEIKFVLASMKEQGPLLSMTHYILILDRSGSMIQSDPKNNLSRWKNVSDAVRSFLKHLESDVLLQKNSKVSILIYNTEVTQLQDQALATEALADSLAQVEVDGGTQFGPPLDQALKIIKKNKDSYDQFMLCLMTDGEADYPTKELKKYTKNLEIMQKLKFTAIGYGTGQKTQEILEPMAKELNGDVLLTLEPEQLQQAFLELIPNFYD